jgi:ATP-binding cassette subfamily B protein/subfamily B ATP-binding cassette protein MsbA
MKPFFRIARGLTRYPAALSASIACSLAVALLWGGNIGAIYPMLEVCLRGKSVQQWIAEDLAEADAKKQAITTELADRNAALTPKRRDQLQADLTALQRTIDLKLRVQPYADHLPNDPFRTVVLFVGFLLAVTALKNLFIVGNLVTTSWAVQRATLDLQNQYTRRVLGLDLASYDRFGTSQLVTHFTESIEHVSRGLHVLLGASVREPLKIISCAIGASLISWRLMLFTLLVAPPTALLISALSRRVRRSLKAHVSDSVHLNKLVFQSVISLPTVQAYGMEREMEKEVDLAGLDRMRRSIKISLWISLTKPVTELAGIMAVGLALVAGAYLVLNQQTHLFGIQMTNQPLTISSMLVFFGMMIGMSDPARKLTDVYSNLQIGVAAAERVSDILDEPSRLAIAEPTADVVTAEPPSTPQTDRQDLAKRTERRTERRGAITFQSVSFGYNVGQPVLDDVTLTIQPGETICIVGENGCGKSTLGKLLLRFYDPTDGKVLIDGLDIGTQDPRIVRKSISLVSQSPALIENTVAANIRFGTPEATDEEVKRAAKLARADEFIEGLENDYQSEVGFDGNRLSGGQKQRIALARAFLRDPAILILDEATNQIDQHSEQLIYDALRDFITDRSCIFVSHRPEAFELCDRIVVMKEGRIVSSGDAETLRTTCATFQKLFVNQFDSQHDRAAA